jgi:tetratricopeptide (TPR) repeat protein
MIYDDFGKPLGQAFPERGVAFSFLTGSPQPFVTQILLEPVSAEAFFVRAQNTWKTNPEAALADLHQTFKREPNHDRAHDLQSKIELASGQVDAALVAAEKAVAINAASGEFRLTLAAALAASGDFARATQHVREAGDSSDPSSTLKAQSLLALGDLLVDQPNPNHKEALQAYMEAIRAADAFANEKHVQPRRQAKLVLVDAHLGAARAICAGAWKKKEAVVPKWLAKAEAAAGDMLQNEAAGDEFRFHVARQTLAALAGQPGLIDESRYAQQVASLAARMQNSSTDARFRAQVQWQTSEALYHAVVNAHARNARNEAQSYAQAAVQYMESAGPHRQQSAALAAFAGRLYFRVGAVHAALANDHPAAVAWYKKAIPLLEQPAPATAEANSKMQGEAFVGMGVSMWHVGDKEEAVRLTTEGVHLFEQAAQQGLIASAELEIPYKNLSAMHGQLGNDAESKQFAELAARSTQDGPVRK